MPTPREGVDDALRSKGAAQMTAAVVSHEATGAEFSTLKPLGFKLSKGETLFFRCLIDATKAHGIKPPKGRDIPSDVKRVVDYYHVKLLMAACLPNPYNDTPEGKARRARQLTAALRGPRVALMTFRVVAASNPYIWHTGRQTSGINRPVAGI